MKRIQFSFLFASLFSTCLLAQEGWFYQHPFPQGNTLNDIFVFDQHRALAVGNTGTIISTTNGGMDWLTIDSGIYDDLKAVHFVNETTGWAVAFWNSSYTPILKTTDGGNTWFEQSADTSAWFESIFFADENEGWIVGQEIILKTEDGGDTWHQQYCDTTDNFNDVCFLGTNSGSL